MNRQRRSKTVSITLNHLDVDIDLIDIETDDLLEELELRKVLHGATKTDVEQTTITDRYFEQRRRATTQGSPVTAEERDFWYHVHGRDV